MNVVIHSTSFMDLCMCYRVAVRPGQNALVGIADAINDASLIHGDRSFPYDHIGGDLVDCCLDDHFDAVDRVDIDTDGADVEIDLHADTVYGSAVDGGMPLDVFVVRYSSALPGLPAAPCLRYDVFSGWVADPEPIRPTDPEPGYGI
jgi:hypothetical protein